MDMFCTSCQRTDEHFECVFDARVRASGHLLDVVKSALRLNERICVCRMNAECAYVALLQRAKAHRGHEDEAEVREEQRADCEFTIAAVYNIKKARWT